MLIDIAYAKLFLFIQIQNLCKTLKRNLSLKTTDSFLELGLEPIWYPKSRLGKPGFCQEG